MLAPVPASPLSLTMFGDRRRGENEDVLAQLDRIRTHVVAPIVEKIELQLEGLRAELRAQGERMERSQAQNERAQEQTHALIRNLTDPETGAITRNEMRMLKDSSDAIHSNFDIRIGKLERAEDGTVTADHERRLRERERPADFWKIVGGVAALVAILGGVIALSGHLVFR